MSGLQPGKCRSCDAEILWGTTAGGASMPLDAEPVADGNCVVDAEGKIVVLKKDLFEQPVEGLRYKSHFATCVNAASHRRKRQ